MVVDLFTCAVCAIVAWHSMLFLFEEMGQGGNAFPGVPSWILQAMIPIGFSVISVRYLIMFFLDLLHMRPPMQEPHA